MTVMEFPGNEPDETGRRNPFGAHVPGQVQTPALTLPDAVRRCRWIAVDIGATTYGVFYLGPAIERASLTRCFDSDHPRTGGTVLAIGARNAEALCRNTRQSTLPCWWGGTDPTATAEALGALQDLTRLPEPEPEGPGIAFPVFGERGQCGLVAFGGRDIALGAAQLYEIHARAFDLFASMSAMSPLAAGHTAQISKREVECLKLTANGLTSGEIATALKLSIHTANQYLTSAAQKLGADNRVHAVSKALRCGLIE